MDAMMRRAWDNPQQAIILSLCLLPTLSVLGFIIGRYMRNQEGMARQTSYMASRDISEDH